MIVFHNLSDGGIAWNKSLCAIKTITNVSMGKEHSGKEKEHCANEWQGVSGLIEATNHSVH